LFGDNIKIFKADVGQPMAAVIRQSRFQDTQSGTQKGSAPATSAEVRPARPVTPR
jgi:hypothetical protein